MCKESHIVCVETELKNFLEALTATCQRMVLTFMEDQTRYRCYGDWMGDSPIPEHLFSQRVETLQAAARQN
jgi:hypothetical protein